MNNKTRPSAFLSLILLSMLLLTFCLTVPAHAELSWDVQVVDEDASGIGNGYCPIAVDSNNNPHIAYSGAPQTRYASWNGSDWNIQTVTEDNNLSGIIHLSLALDSSNTPYIMYYTESSYVDDNGIATRSVNVKLTVWKNSRWNIEPVLDSSNFVEFGNMVLDSNDHPHFLATQGRFVSSENMTFLSSILYVSWDGRDWNIHTVASDVNVANIGFLALSPHGYPSIVYIGGGVKYARWTGTTWESYNVGTPDTTRDASGPCYLALDSNGTPHISARVYLSGQMLYPGYTSTIMHATANLTEPEVSQAFPDSPVLIVSAVIIIGTVIAVIAYFWKKKTKH